MCSGCLNMRISPQNLLQTMLILLSVSPSLSGFAWDRQNKPWMQEDKTNLSPVFEVTALSPKISVPIGQTAMLPCTIRNLGDKVVSWIRSRDLHILTSGIYSYTSDNRFQVIHDRASNSWSLRIKRTKISDSGKYECQVNTEPKMNNALLLTVTESHMHDSPMDDVNSGQAYATIRGPRELFVRAGSTITFTCVVSRPSPSSLKGADLVARPSRSHLKWTHAGRDVSFQSSRGGISVDTDYRSSDITSRLTVAMVRPEDAGNYTCEDVNVRPDSVSVIVFEGEHTEAMQRDFTNGAASKRFLFLSLFFVHLFWALNAS